MKMNFYKYILMTMAFLLGFHLYYVIMHEAIILRYSMEMIDEWIIEYVAQMRLEQSFSNMLTFMVCTGLFCIAIGLYLVEFYICKYIKGKREQS